ncbi:histidinol dehydrogenase [Niallia circulans]|jgi:histidinol dehydrogenase|uniref:histidinol dehydrogenase n=1 Tax=Niallia circulans TaxID=1397 RepID=UPI00203EE4D1|nr:histidinol dehydrogenase [Niallia circulans]MCM2982077.1 histidinol dehydrogenase [Niallia circulans]MED5101164.1 histidinol dehydrogenase [Niallia circulans]
MRIVTDIENISLKRSVDAGTEEQRKAVREIMGEVKRSGDQALIEYTKKWDKAELTCLRVKEEEVAAAYNHVEEEMVSIIKEAAANIKEYHQKQLKTSWDFTQDNGSVLGQRILPLDSVGVYVPGGTAAYPSSVLMNVIPALVAGVQRIVMVSPPNENGILPSAVLVAADIAGVKEIYKVGGAQAIAALAYGTESIEKVDKIVGPGNIFVALAKREVFGDVAIDMIAGPSEIAIIADETASAKEIAADLLSQAEHDERASSVLVTTSILLAEEVSQEVKQQLNDLPRKEIAEKSIDQYGLIVVVETLDKAVAVINTIAPEHLEILTKNPYDILEHIRHAGSIFIGRYSSEPVGDYFAGTNHVLPTNGTARFSNPLNVDDFQKKSSITHYSEAAFKENAHKIAKFARLEGLEAHARAIEARYDD